MRRACSNGPPVGTDDPKALRDQLAQSRAEARELSEYVGKKRLRRHLEKADADLRRRLKQAEGLGGPGKDSFTATQMRAALAQVRDVTRSLAKGMKGVAIEQAEDAADAAASHTVEYLAKAERRFRGITGGGLPIEEAGLMDAARSGARASVLRRLASSGEPVAEADAEPHPAKVGVLERYGIETIGHFEDELRTGLLARKPWAEVRADLVDASPFLQEAPGYYAERIVRCETAAAYNRSGWEAIRAADDELGDMLKIISSVMDSRTGPDSKNTHGELRRPEEAFEYIDYKGSHLLYQHPPDRPNDRSCVVPHRMSWPLPDYLRPLPDGAVQAAYTKARIPYHGRPKLTTVNLRDIGR